MHERYVGLGEPAVDRAVHLKDAVAVACGGDRHVDGPPDAVIRKDPRRAKAAFDVGVARDHGLAPVEGIPAGTFQVGPGPRPDGAGFPTHSGPDDEWVLGGQVFHGLAVPGVHSLGAEPGCLLEQRHEARRLEREQAEGREEFLLVKPVGQFVGRGSALLGERPGKMSRCSSSILVIRPAFAIGCNAQRGRGSQ